MNVVNHSLRRTLVIIAALALCLLTAPALHAQTATPTALPCGAYSTSTKTVKIVNNMTVPIAVYGVKLSNCTEVYLDTVSANSSKNIYNTTYTNNGNYIRIRYSASPNNFIMTYKIVSNTNTNNPVTINPPPTPTPTSTPTFTATPTNTPCASTITGFRLWNVGSGSAVPGTDPILNTYSAAIEDMPAGFNVEALTSGTVGSIKFQMSKLGQSSVTVHKENGAPYRLMGDTTQWLSNASGNAGVYVITGTVYSAADWGGVVCSTPKSLTLTFTNRPTPTPTNTGTATATPTNTSSPTAWACYATGGIRSEELWGLDANNAGVYSFVSHADYNDPSKWQPTKYHSSFEMPFNVMPDGSGRRVRGWLIPPVSGAYTFYLASDDSSELWLSIGDNPGDKRKVAWMDGWVDQNAADRWTKYGTNNGNRQNSDPVTLVAGQRYYIEAVMKESYGGDNLGVAWTGPNINTITIIPGAYLTPYNSSCTLYTPTPTPTSTNTTASTPTATPSATFTRDPLFGCLPDGALQDTTITFNNLTNAAVRLKYVDFNCSEVHKDVNGQQTLGSSQSISYSTYVSVTWRVYDGGSNTLLRQVTTTAGSNVVNIVEFATPTPTKTPLPPTPTWTPTITRTPTATRTPLPSATPVATQPACIGNHTWLDANKDGLKGNELYFTNIKVNLWSDNDNNGIPETLIAAGKSDSTAGLFRFCSLPAGIAYHLQFIAPYGYTLTRQNVGNDETVDSDPNPGSGFTSAVVLTSTQINYDVDAGLFKAQACGGNRVWKDSNGNGFYNTGEPYVSNVAVKLLEEVVNGQDVEYHEIASRVTDASGGYSFCNVLVGKQYRLQFVAPNGYELTTLNAPGSTAANDSDADPNNIGYTRILTFTQGQVNTDIDAGLIQNSVVAAQDELASLPTVSQRLDEMLNHLVVAGFVIRSLGDVSVAQVDADATSLLGDTVSGFRLFRSVTAIRSDAVQVPDEELESVTNFAGTYWVEVDYVDGAMDILMMTKTPEAGETPSDGSADEPSDETMMQKLFLPLVTR